MSIGFPDMQWVNRVADSLENGFRIGARGQGRANAEGKNLKSFYEEGYKAADAVADWITKGLMTGPFDRLVTLRGFVEYGWLHQSMEVDSIHIVVLHLIQPPLIVVIMCKNLSPILCPDQSFQIASEFLPSA